ncbi:29023_t:CDS:1, partial [Gigaspora margarita]
TTKKGDEQYKKKNRTRKRRTVIARKWNKNEEINKDAKKGETEE